MKLIVTGSNSTGNAYALDSGNEILLLEAGCKMADVKRSIDYRLKDVAGCIVTHHHGDHAKYATEYAKFGVKVYGNEDLARQKQFPYGTYTTMVADKSYHLGGFTVVPFENHHDVPIFGYLVHHKDMGSLLFSTDSYKIGIALTGVSHFLIEANYSDEYLKQAVWDGQLNKAQADRIMLSHMSLENCIRYLRDCQAEKSQTIILCHLSSRHSDVNQFSKTVASAFGVPCYVAQKGLTVELNKELI